MTIRDVEVRLDLPRASIRFYEKEGLVCPGRSENGYRDYSEADVEVLGKVKLLRQLGLSLEEIRELQKGELSLTVALDRRLGELEGEQRELERSVELCRRLRDTGATYATLPAGDFLAELEREGRSKPPAGDILPNVYHPWRRFFARSLDLALLGMLLTLPELLVLRLNPSQIGGVLGTLLNGYLSWGLLLVLEPLLLSTWGYTPGKWLFGLVLRDSDGEKLTYGDALRRTVQVFGRGEGYNVPFYNLWRNYQSYKLCAENRACEWDQECSYTIRDERALRCAAFVAVRAAMAVLLWVAALTAYLPPHHGPLTPENYAANINDVRSFHLGQEVYPTRLMNDQGVWEERLTANPVWRFSAEPVNHQLTVEDGLVTGVRLEWSGEPGEFFFYDGSYDRYLALFVLLNHDRRIGSRAVLEDPCYDYDSMEDTVFRKDGWRVEYHVGYDGEWPVNWSFTAEKLD